jgi:PAS domain S-box-containing protein
MEADDAIERFEALAECCEAVVFVTDLSMRMVFANAALARETGFTAADFQFPQADNPFIHRDDAERVARFLGDFISGEARVSVPLDNRFLDRWGRTHLYRSVVSKVRHAGAPALMFVCRQLAGPAAADVDDRQYRALVESADDAIIRLGSRGQVLFANRRTYAWLGYSAVELGRLGMADIVSETDRDAFSRHVASCAGATETTRFEVRLATRSGQEVCAQAVLRSLAEFGAPCELLAILRDITGEKRAATERGVLEERMRELQHALIQRERLAAIGEMAAVMAHEIRNPLGVIFNSIGGLRRLVRGPHDAQALLDLAWEEAERLKRLVADLLEFASPYRPSLEVVDVAPIVAEAVAAAQRDPVFPRGSGAPIEVRLPPGMPQVHADPARLHRALVNLLTNALQHVAPGGRVQVSAGPAGDAELRITVHNDGAPLAPEVAQRVFDPFFTTRAAGTGLGLAVVRRIVEDLGGRIELDACDRGDRGDRGVSFSVWLQRSPATSTPTTAVENSRP